jgi:hypothetical protein
MKLYDVPRNSYVRVLPVQDEDSADTPQTKGKVAEVSVPVSAPEIKAGQLIYFDHVDGMYSLCYEVDEVTKEHGQPCHMAAWTEVEIVDPDVDLTFAEIREKIGRSGYGKDGKGEYRESSLSKMNDNWVEASINFVPDNHPHRKYYIEEMKYRQDNDISIADPEA